MKGYEKPFHSSKIIQANSNSITLGFSFRNVLIAAMKAFEKDPLISIDLSMQLKHPAK